VYPNRADIARGLGRQVVDRSILPNLSDHMGEPWEEICRGFVRDEATRGRLPVRLSRVGRWWNTDHSTEIDVVGMNGRRVVLAGSVKWSKRVGRSELDRLRRATESPPNRSEDLHLVLFARETVEDIDDHDVSTYTAADLCA